MKRVARLLLLVLASALGGCAVGPLDLGTPRIRVGGLPYPGWTNYVPLEPPFDLGEHRYQTMRTQDDVSLEISSAMIYTRHAGFIDMAHVRSTIDWVRYVYLVSLDRLMMPQPTAAPALRWSWLGMEYRLHVNAPRGWYEKPPHERLPHARQAASVLGQRLAVSISTWHEIGSWYGQMLVPPIQEIRSAFTWDDSSSHVFAALVGARSLQSGDPHNQSDWNRTVTRELAKALADLGPVGQDCQNQALERSQGVWWFSGQTLRRDLDTGLQSNLPKQPWLVRDLACEADPAFAPSRDRVPMVLQLPDWGALGKPGLVPTQSWFDWEVTMPNWLTRRVLGCEQGCTPHAFRGEAALLTAIERIREQVVQLSGPEALVPHAWPSTGVPVSPRR